MRITGGKTIRVIQEEFNRLFPALKIEFYTTPHSHKTGTSEKYHIKNTSRLKEISTDVATKSVTVNSSLTVTDLEQKIQDNFRVGAQVFRKSGNVWLQTTATDNLTLEEQNKKGLESSFTEPQNRSELDYREQS